MSSTNQHHLLEVLTTEIAKIGDDARVAGYTRDLRDHLATVLAFERDHRTKGTNINQQLLGQVEALSRTLTESDWQPSVSE